MTLLRLLVATLVMLLIVAAHSLWDYVELRKLVAEIEAVRARGEPVALAEAIRLVSDAGAESKAGVYYMAAAMAVEGSKAHDFTPALREWLAGAAPDPRREVAGPLGVHVEELRDSLALADKAGGLPFTRFPPGTEYSYRTFHVMTLGRALSARTLSLSVSNQGEAAVDSAISSLQLRRVLRQIRSILAFPPPHETAALLSLTIPSPAALGRLQEALEREDARNSVLEGLLMDRARVIELLWRRYYGDDPVLPQDYRLPMRSVGETIRRPLFTRRFVRTIRAWSDVIEAARKPWPARIEATNAALALHRDLHQDEQRSPFFVMPPAVSPGTLIIDRSSITAVAIERFRRDHGGAPPESLADLVPTYLSAVPADPYTGGALRFVRNSAAYIVYSVGQNKIDDGGDVISDLEMIRRGFAPRTSRDVGVRVLFQH